MDITAMVAETESWLRSKTDMRPEVVVVLGSGLGVLASTLQDSVSFPYEDIPHFAKVGVAGHSGRLSFGTLEGRRVAVLEGRFHLYEGHAPMQVALPMYALQRLGASWLLVTNAAGGISRQLEPGQLVLIRDHINFMGCNPLVGLHDDSLGQRFPDMSEPYDPALRWLAQEIALEQGISLKEGIYLATLGPSYETPAEIQMFQQWGADLVGMSTVPEVLAARRVGMRVLGISCVSNVAAGILPQPLTHDEVLATTQRVQTAFIALVRGVLNRAVDVNALAESLKSVPPQSTR